MIFFETMPMEGKLIILGSICLLWEIIDKFFVLRTEIGSKIKFIFLRTFLGFIAGLVVGLIYSTFSGNIEMQTRSSLIFGVILAFIFGIYGIFVSNDKEKFAKVYISDLDWAQTGWVSLFAASIIMYCFVQAFKIPTGSMRMTLIEGDHLFVNKFIYGIKIPFTQKRVLVLKKIKYSTTNK